MILVTGGAGFIGSALCAALLAQGHRVVCLDNLVCGRRATIAPLEGHPRFRLIVQDVAAPIDLEVEAIFNLACPASPAQYRRDPIGVTRTSVLGALSVLDLARRTGAKVLQASTSEVYGDPEAHPQAETYWGHVNPIGERACYDEGKRCAESLFFDYHRQHGVRIKVARLFNTYGPGLLPDDGRVISNFIAQALAGHPLTVHGDGRQTRSFCYVDDMVTALIGLMATEAAVTGPINLGNPDEVTMLGLAREVIALTRAPAEITFHPAPPDDPRRRCPDIALAAATLGWAPTTELRDGLAKTIAWFRLQGSDGASG